MNLSEGYLDVHELTPEKKHNFYSLTPNYQKKHKSEYDCGKSVYTRKNTIY